MTEKVNSNESNKILSSMELLTAQEVMIIFKKKKPKDIYNMLYAGTLPRNLTLKIGSNLYFVKSKLEEYLQNQYKTQHESTM
jgi:predicted DNA-binding transcriptional regulator AlpA